jgi:outer membrane protein TolC
MHSDPKIRAAQASVDKAHASISEVRDAYIPSASITGGYGKSVGVPLSVPVVFSIASQSLLFNFSQRDNFRAAAAGLQSATLAWQDARQKVAEDVTNTYVNLSNAQQRQAAMAQEYSFANRLVQIVNERVEAGTDTRMELLRTRRTVAQIHLQQLQIDDDVATLTDHLVHLTGIAADAITIDPKSIPALPSLDSITLDNSDNAGIQSAFANAKSKQESAFGEARYRFRPQISFGANYSRISTTGTNYVLYYPAFKDNLSNNAASIGFQIQVPIFDRAHQDRAKGATADAAKARFDAEEMRNRFLEDRFKLSHSTAQLAAHRDLARIDFELAQEQINIVLVELSSSNTVPDRPQITPKDDQNARLQERARYIDLLEAQFQLDQAQISLMRQTGQLEAWLKLAPEADPAIQIPSSLTRPR